MTIQRQLVDLRAYAQQFCEDAGDPRAAIRLVLNATDTRLTFTTIDAAGCGAPISGFIKPEQAHAKVRQILNRVLRQRARARAIRKAGDGDNPPWSIDMHPVALAALRNGGVNPALIAIDGAGLDQRSTIERASDGTLIRVGRARCIAGRATIATISGRGHPADEVVSLYETSQSHMQRIMLRTDNLPETVISAFIGRRLRDIATHPLLEGAGNVLIEGVEVADGVIHLTPADERVTLATPPFEPDWLRFPWQDPAFDA